MSDSQIAPRPTNSFLEFFSLTTAILVKFLKIFNPLLRCPECSFLTFLSFSEELLCCNLMKWLERRIS